MEAQKELFLVGWWITLGRQSDQLQATGLGQAWVIGGQQALALLSLQSLSKPAGRLTQPGLGTQDAVNARLLFASCPGCLLIL